MIVVLDNGQSYSDHAICFVAATDEQVKLLHAVFTLAELERAFRHEHEHTTMVGVVSEIEWYGRLATMSRIAEDIMRELWSPISPAMIEVLAKLGVADDLLAAKAEPDE